MVATCGHLVDQSLRARRRLGVELVGSFDAPC